MPKGRYEIMRAYMPKKGRLGLDMMLRSCTVQVNLDYSSEVDMVRKFRVSLALQPIVTALFANSPFTARGLCAQDPAGGAPKPARGDYRRSNCWHRPNVRHGSCAEVQVA